MNTISTSLSIKIIASFPTHNKDDGPLLQPFDSVFDKTNNKRSFKWIQKLEMTADSSFDSHHLIFQNAILRMTLEVPSISYGYKAGGLII
jgi:hypothetical protein